MSNAKHPEPQEVELVHSSYQPSKAELEEDVRIDATPEELAQAVLRPAKVRYVKRPPKREG